VKLENTGCEAGCEVNIPQDFENIRGKFPQCEAETGTDGIFV
jgi:hypothetical protein